MLPNPINYIKYSPPSTTQNVSQSNLPHMQMCSSPRNYSNFISTVSAKSTIYRKYLKFPTIFHFVAKIHEKKIPIKIKAIILRFSLWKFLCVRPKKVWKSRKNKNKFLNEKRWIENNVQLWLWWKFIIFFACVKYYNKVLFSRNYPIKWIKLGEIGIKWKF